MAKKTGEAEYEFSLVLSGVTTLDDRVANALFEAGCDDATPALRFGRLTLTFARQAPSMKDAILSAIKDVHRAGIGAEVVRVDECHLVTQADIAHRIGRSRQLVHQYVTGKRGPGGFPAPVCNVCDAPPLWAWGEVAGWLWSNDMIKEDEFRAAEQVALINTLLELRIQRQSAPGLAEELERVIVGGERTRRKS
jgi:hypothetical protein